MTIRISMTAQKAHESIASVLLINRFLLSFDKAHIMRSFLGIVTVRITSELAGNVFIFLSLT